MEKKFVVQLSPELFKVKIDIETELHEGNKTNEKLYSLILKAKHFYTYQLISIHGTAIRK